MIRQCFTALGDWGWDTEWSDHFTRLAPQGTAPARVVGQERDRWFVRAPAGLTEARLASAARVERYPVVGDWVVVREGPMASDPFSIVAVLPRRTAFSRGAAGGGPTEQVLAANVDLVWIVHGLDAPPNPRRFERYLAVAWESGASPAIVLTKSDLTDNVETALADVRRVAMGVPIHVASTEDPTTADRLRANLTPGRTVVLLGPSGAGKSTLLNLLASATLASTGEVRSGDRKGRHTTTRRALFSIPGGALVIDTPGLRELRLWVLGEGLDQAYPDIEWLAQGCRFRDCQHETEPGCAVLETVSAGRLAADRLAGYRKLRAEAAYEQRKVDPRARAAAVAEHKSQMKTMRYHPKFRKGE